MRRALAIAFGVLFAIIACGGSTTTIDGGTDAGMPDAKKVACWGDARTAANRMCMTNQDCAIVDHTNDCCGTIVEEGVRLDQVNNVHDEELAANAGCSQCGCPPAQTTDETGQNGGAYVASCDMGVCTGHAQ